jgi:choice-of-anchor A domain-containing protein
LDCVDLCPDDPTKIRDVDSDGDGILDCNEDQCPNDPFKTEPGRCGCGFYDTGAFGGASNFLLWAINDFTSQSSDIQGKVAVGRDLKPQSYDFGDPACYVNPACSCDASLIVGRDAVLKTGNLNQGTLHYGNSLVKPATFSLPAHCNPKTVKDLTLPITFFPPTAAWLKAVSASWSGLANTGVSTYPVSGSYGLTVTVPAATFQVFPLSGAKISGWGNAWKVQTWIDKVCSKVIPGSTIIINISGTDVSLLGNNWSCFGPTKKNYNVIFNFYQATSLKLAASLYGTVLAPYASVTCDSTGEITGQAFVNNWCGTVQINKGNIFDGCAPIVIV